MKRLVTLLLLFCLTWFAGQTLAQEGTAAASRRLLVNFQNVPVVIVPETEDSDAGLAVAWTLRPNRKHTTVDWSLYSDEEGAYELLKKFPDDFEHPADGDYRLFNGVVDLKRKVFTHLPSRDPYFRSKNHGSLEANWSSEAHGTRYGVIANNGGGHSFERTYELWLVTIDARGTRFSELTPAADKAVRAYLRKHDPEDAASSFWKYDFLNGCFQGQKLSVHFDAMIPIDVPVDDGTVHFALPRGTVTGTTKR